MGRVPSDLLSLKLRKISEKRKLIEKILKKRLKRERDRRSITAIAVLTPSTLGLPDIPFPENVRPYLPEKEYEKVKKLWEEIKEEIEDAYERFDEQFESYRRQVMSHYLKKLRSYGNLELTDEQREDLYMCLNLGINKAFLCYDHEKEKDNPAKFFLKVMRGVFRTYLSSEVLGLHIPPTQYQKKVSTGDEIPIVVPVSQIIKEPEDVEENHDEEDNFLSLNNLSVGDYFTEMEIRDIIGRLVSPFREVLQSYIEGGDELYPPDVHYLLLSVALLTVFSLLTD